MDRREMNPRGQGTTSPSDKHQVTIPLDEVLGVLTGVFEGFDLDALRDEWS